MAKIFISYRREDSQYPADLLHKALAPHVENPKEDIFIDVDNIPLGVNFARYLDEKVSQCEILLALIGPRWSSATDEHGQRRLDNENDFVRIEIASALKRGIPVVPVLLDGAPVPRASDLPEDLKELAVRNGEEIRRITFDSDAERLIKKLGLADDETRIPSPGSNAYWEEIKQTVEVRNYENFITHFPDHPQTFEARKRKRQLEEYSSVDKTNAKAIADFRKRKSETDPLFEALADQTKREMDRAARNALKSEQNERSAELADPNLSSKVGAEEGIDPNTAIIFRHRTSILLTIGILFSLWIWFAVGWDGWYLPLFPCSIAGAMLSRKLSLIGRLLPSFVGLAAGFLVLLFSNNYFSDLHYFQDIDLFDSGFKVVGPLSGLVAFLSAFFFGKLYAKSTDRS